MIRVQTGSGRTDEKVDSNVCREVRAKVVGPRANDRALHSLKIKSKPLSLHSLRRAGDPDAQNSKLTFSAHGPGLCDRCPTS